MYYFITFILLFVVVEAFQHPGVLVSQYQLNFIKAQVDKKAEPFYTAYLKALNSSYANLTYVPLGPPPNGTISCGAYSKPDYGCTFDSIDSKTAYVQALLWFITGNKKYAENAILLLNTYSSKLKEFTNYNGPLQAGWSAQKWTKAAEIIRYTNAGWSEKDITSYSNLLKNVYLPKIYDGSEMNGNWELSMIDGMIGIAVFNDDSVLFDHAILFWKQRVPAYFYYEPLDGDKPVKAPRGSPSWYGEVVFNSSVNGLCQETCRDLGHTQYGLSSIINTAETAFIQGVDLYASQEDRLIAAMEFNANLLIGGNIPPYLCSTGTVDKYYFPTFEVGYNHFHNRKKLNLPNSWKEITLHVRELIDLSDLTSVWETLTHG